MIYVTGDCHAAFTKFNTKNFPEQMEMTRDDFVIICGDFGLWHDCKNEAYWLNWLAEKPFTTLFVDGNHENFDRLYGGEFPVVDFHGGKAHRIRNNVYHLMRGYVFDLQGKRFFAFGGASSHDIEDGILDPADFPTKREFLAERRSWKACGKMFRINHQSWWKEELPSEAEMQLGRESLKMCGYTVDFVISHCLPHQIATVVSNGRYRPDRLTTYFDSLLQSGLRFDAWYCGHYHCETQAMQKFNVLYAGIVRIV